MATTTNYGWETADDTDLVKDGAAAIRTLGSAIDTTTKALNPSTTLGDIEYRSATANTNTRLGIGTAGQILTVTGGVPAWAAAPAAGGGYTLLSTASPSAASVVTFSSISQSYKHLVLVWRNLYHDANASGTTWGLRMNNDSGAFYSFYSNGFSNANELTQSTTQIGSTNASAGFLSNMTASSTAVDSQGFGSAIIYDYTATTNHQVEWKSFGTATGFQNSAANGVGSYKTTSAVDRLDIVRLGGTQTVTGTILLYGVS